MARPKGSKNKQRMSLIRNRIMAAAERARVNGNVDGLDAIIDAQFERARGRVMEQRADGTLYSVAPDPNAARVILEQMFGRPKETVEVKDTTEDKFKGLPQVILVPPPGFKEYAPR